MIEKSNTEPEGGTIEKNNTTHTGASTTERYFISNYSSSDSDGVNFEKSNGTNASTIENHLLLCNYSSSDLAYLSRVACILPDVLTTSPLSPESCEFLRTTHIPERWKGQMLYHDLPESKAAICKAPQEPRNWTFITFGDVMRSGKGTKKRIESAKNLSEKVSNLANFDQSFAFKLDDIDDEAMEQHENLFNNFRVFNMVAKVYFLNRTAHTSPDGTILVWMDSDLKFQNNLDLLGCLAENSKSGIAPIHSSHYLELWLTKRDLFVHFGMDENDRVLHTVQMSSGVLSLRVNDYTRKFLSEWLNISYQPVLLQDGTEVPSVVGENRKRGFWKHREDQSILSLLVKREGIPSYQVPYVGRDRSDITSIAAGYCEPGVDAELLMNIEWSFLKGRDLMEHFMKKLPRRKHFRWFGKLRSAYLDFWNPSVTE